MSYLFYNFADHHHQYMDVLSKEMRSQMFTGSLAKKEIVSIPLSYSYGVTNSLYGKSVKPRTVSILSENSLSGLSVLMGHSMFATAHHVVNSYGDGQSSIGVLPGYFKWLLGYRIPDHCAVYPGHYMGLYHLNNPPVTEEDDAVLFMPVAGTEKISVIARAISKLHGMKIYIRVHPAVENDFKDMAEFDFGISLREYQILEACHRNVEIILPSKEPLFQSIDRCKYVMATPPSSTLIEAAIRANIVGKEKRIIYTENMEHIPEIFGINVSDSPTIDDFSVIPKHITDEIVIEKAHQGEEVARALKLATWRR